MAVEQLIVMVRGKRACRCMATAIPRVEAGLRALGVIRDDMSGLVTQGAWNGGAGAVAASAGTHAGGGVWDVDPKLVDTDAKRAAWWAAGIVPFYRITADAPVSQWPPHGHVVTIGCPHLAPSAAAQIEQARKGRNALQNSGPFRGSIPSPIRAWDQVQEEDDMATPEEVAGAIFGSTFGARGKFGEIVQRLDDKSASAEDVAQAIFGSTFGAQGTFGQLVQRLDRTAVEQAGQIAGLIDALRQVGSGSVDVAAVEAAARKGAQDALKGATVSVDLGGGA